MSQETALGVRSDGLQVWDFGELSRQLKQVSRQNALLKTCIIVSIPVFIAVAVFSFYHFVWSYAVLNNIRMTQDAANPTHVRVTYEVKHGGRVNYSYGELWSAEKPYETGDKDDFNCRVGTGGKPEFIIYVRSRQGIFPSRHTEHFSRIR